MIDIVIQDKNYGEFCDYFAANVTKYEEFSSRIYYKPREKLYGNIDDDKIWVVRTKQVVGGLPQRYFTGTISEEAGAIKITGKFDFDFSCYAFLVLIVVIFFVRFYTQLHFELVAALFAVILLYFGLWLLTSRYSEKVVLSFLQGEIKYDK